MSDSIVIEQFERRVEALEAELERVRAAVSIDLQNWTTKYTALMRENGRLKAEIERQEEEEPEHDDVRNLLILWKHETGRNAKCDIGAGSKRYKIAKAAIKRWGVKRSTNAIKGLALKPYSGPRGRSHECYLGAGKHADVEHALGDETRMERCEGYWLEHINPTLEQQPLELVPDPAPPADGEREPESIERQFTRSVYGDDSLLKHKPASAERGRRERPDDDRVPIDKVLGALSQAGSSVAAGANPDAWSAQCPAHEDRSPSLSVHRKPDGTVLLHCWAGCDTADVIGVIGLDWRDLWTGSENDYERADGPRVRKVVPGHLRHAMEALIAMEAAA